jgi:hypothetical protein
MSRPKAAADDFGEDERPAIPVLDIDEKDFYTMMISIGIGDDVLKRCFEDQVSVGQDLTCSPGL